MLRLGLWIALHEKFSSYTRNQIASIIMVFEFKACLSWKHITIKLFNHGNLSPLRLNGHGTGCTARCLLCICILGRGLKERGMNGTILKQVCGMMMGRLYTIRFTKLIYERGCGMKHIVRLSAWLNVNVVIVVRWQLCGNCSECSKTHNITLKCNSNSQKWVYAN